MNKVVILFQSIHFVIKAEPLCTANNIKYRLIPVPKDISPECGMAIEIAESDKKLMSDLLEQKSIRYTFHVRTRDEIT